jgi:hypothetical protein
MKDIVYSPSHGEPQLIHHKGNLFDNFEGPISFGLELHFLMVDFQVGHF